MSALRNFMATQALGRKDQMDMPMPIVKNSIALFSNASAKGNLSGSTSRASEPPL